MIFRFIDWLAQFRYVPIRKEWLHPIVLEYVLTHERRGIKEQSVVYEVMQMNQITYHEAYALYRYIKKNYRTEH